MDAYTDIMIDALESGSIYYTQKPMYKNTYKKVSVVLFDNPFHFYVKLDEQNSEYDNDRTLEEELSIFTENFERSTPIRLPQLGMPVMAPGPSNPTAYCRGQIVAVTDQMATVNLIDQPVVICAAIETLRVVPKSLIRIPKLLLLCRLYNVMPLNEKWPETNWMETFQGNKIMLNFLSQDEYAIYDVQMDINDQDFGVSLIFDQGIAKTVELKSFMASGPYPAYDYSAWEGSKVPAFGVSVISMELAWFQLQPDCANAVFNATATYTSNLTEAKKQESFSKEVGAPCLALFTDNEWYRVEIKDIVGPGSYKVFFVDFGNTEFVNDEQMTKIPEHLIQIPIAATEVSIIDVLGLQGKEELAKLKALVENKDLIASIEDPHMNIGDKERVLIAVFHEDGTSLSEHFSRPKDVTLEGEPLSFDIADETFCNLMIGGPSEFYPGYEYPGVISYAESVRSVWLQLNDSEERTLKMGPELQKYYSKLDMQMPSNMLRKGIYCVAQQSSDSQYYRAVIKGIDDVNGNASVLYIDYGNDEEVPLTSLKPLATYFARDPALSIQAALDVEMRPDADEDKVVNTILDFAEDKKLYVTLTHVNSLNYASIKIDLSDILCTVGLVERTNAIMPSFGHECQ